MNRRLAAAAVGVGGLVALLWGCWPETLQRRILPDGSELVLHSVTYGRRHRMSTGSGWRDQLGQMLPEGVARRMGSQFVAAGETNELRFWLVRSGQGAGSASRYRAVVVDSHGCELGLNPISETARFSQKDRELWMAAFTVFPRREPSMILRILVQSRATSPKWTVCAEFNVPNPGRGSFPVWPPVVLPQTNRVEDLDVVLFDAVSGVEAGQWPPTPWAPGERPGVYLRFGIRQGQRQDPPWAIVGLGGWTDPLGQVAPGRGYSLSRTSANEGDYGLITSGGLCLQEAAWSLGVDVARVSDFPPEDLWAISGVPVPAADDANSVVDAATNLHGAQWRLHGVIGPQSKTPKSRRMLSDVHLLHLSCLQVPPDVQLKLARVADARGMSLVPGGQGYDGPDYHFAVRIPRGVQTLNVVFAVTRKVRVEFRARPRAVDAEEVRRLAR